MTKLFFPRIESLRGLAALAVVLFHVVQSGGGLSADLFAQRGFAIASYQFILETLTSGTGAVILFFVLSGFVMGVNIDTSKPLTPSLYGRFLTKRFFRLMPMVFVSVLFAVAVRETFMGETYSLKLILENMLLRDVSINGPLWSLQLEVLASLVYPLALFAFVRSPVLRTLMLLIAIPLSWRTSLFLPAFLFGLLIPTIGKAVVEQTGRMFVPLAFLFCACAPIGFTFELISLTNGILLMTFGAFGLVAWAMYGSGPITVLDNRLSRYLGRISYSLYLIHYPIVLAVSKFAPENFWMGQVTTLLFSLLFSIGLADLCNRYIEIPCTRLGRLKFQRKLHSSHQSL